MEDLARLAHHLPLLRGVAELLHRSGARDHVAGDRTVPHRAGLERRFDVHRVDSFSLLAAVGVLVAAVGGITWAIVRRYVQRPYRIRIKSKPEHAIILGTFFVIGATGFVTEGLRIARTATTALVAATAQPSSNARPIEHGRTPKAWAILATAHATRLKHGRRAPNTDDATRRRS